MRSTAGRSRHAAADEAIAEDAALLSLPRIVSCKAVPQRMFNGKGLLTGASRRFLNGRVREGCAIPETFFRDHIMDGNLGDAPITFLR
jgi:hypothetical protein